MLQTRCSDVQMFVQDSAIVPRWWVPPVLRPRGSRSPSLSVAIITDRPSYTRAFSVAATCVTASATTMSLTSRFAPSLRLFCSRVKTHLFQLPPPLPDFLYTVPVKWRASLSDTFVIFVTYLLTITRQLRTRVNSQWRIQCGGGGAAAPYWLRIFFSEPPFLIKWI